MPCPCLAERIKYGPAAMLRHGDLTIAIQAEGNININKLKRKRSFRFQKIQLQNQIEDDSIAFPSARIHLFCECENVREAWFWLRQRLLGLLPQNGGRISNFEFLNLMYDSGPFDSEILWLIGVYILFVWNSVICKKKVICQNSVQSEVQQKYLDHHEARKPPLGHISGLF